MALAREAVSIGHVPLEDRFAYTPTLFPSVHHEWGSGAILFLLTSATGAAGLLLLKYSLAAGIAFLCAAGARRRGATWGSLAPLAPIVALLLATGFSTLRAQVFTLLFTAVLLLALEADRRGRRGWIVPWLAGHAVWLNLHAGFVVGFVLVALHAVEARLRGRPARHLALVLAAMAVLVLANPYGWKFVPALWQGIAFDRSLVTEWDPVWREAPAITAVFGFSVLVATYAVARRGWRRLEGWPLLAAAFLAAGLHERHLAIYAVVWCSLVPAWIRGTELAQLLESAWMRRRRAQAAVWVIVGTVSAVVLAREEPWRLRVPANPGEHAVLLYPAGAVSYLRESGFHGNLMTPFTAGAYVSWRLHPLVRVSFDGRYEAAYPPGAALENRDFYAAREGWRATLERYPTDAVLAPVASRVCAALEGESGWDARYRDDAYAVYVRSGSALPRVDRRGQRIEASFP
jgi:hypothetical protein